MKLVVLAAAVTIAGISAASAQPYHGPYGPVHRVDVYTGDLDLNDPAQLDEAAYRIDHAAHIACRPFPDIRVLQEYNDYAGCKAEAFDEGMAELQHRAHHPLRRGRVTTHEYIPEPPPPPPPHD